MSLGGDFPVAKKDYRQISQVLYDANSNWPPSSDYSRRTRITRILSRCFGIEEEDETKDDEIDKILLPKHEMKIQVRWHF